jgi:hypothetical protein
MESSMSHNIYSRNNCRITTYIRLVAYSLAGGAGIYALILVLFFYFSLVE